MLGISPDGAKSHRKFRAKYALPYRLLADEGHHVAQEYGVWKEKSLYGVKRMGIERTTFVIDREGRVARIFPKVRLDGHVDEVVRAVGALTPAE